MIYLYLKDSTFTAVKFQTSYVKGVPFCQVEGIWKGTSASSGFSRPDTTLQRERTHCKQPSASLIKPPSSAMDKQLNFEQVVKNKLRLFHIC